LIEFTGERVIPGQVDVDLWNEHLARYAFAARLAAGRRVLDAGCGTGYGSATLAQQALSVTGLDVAPDAIVYAREHYGDSGVRYLEGSCCAMPVADAGFDLVVSFEVIEHLADWQTFLEECRRVLAPGGLLVLSTPNRDAYAEARRLSGPNPFHTHEFAFDEFASALKARFPHIHLYVQNHVEGIVFQPACPNGQGQPELQQAGLPSDPGGAQFFVAVCSSLPHPAPPPLVYIPTTANVLREREMHIDKLQIDINGLREEKQKLVDLFREQNAALDEANRWGRNLDVQLAAAAARIIELDAENDAKTGWARRLEAELDATGKELAHLNASRWVRLGKRLRIVRKPAGG
jgi:ubiquinone biosynthesis O-methyltransferase